MQQPHQFGGQDQQRDKIPEAGKEIAPVTHSTKDLGDKLTELVRDQNSLQGIQSLASMVSDRFGSTTDYLKQATSEFSTLRERSAQVAKLNDWPNSTPFTLQQTPEPARAGLTLEGGVDSREESAARAAPAWKLTSSGSIYNSLGSSSKRSPSSPGQETSRSPKPSRSRVNCDNR